MSRASWTLVLPLKGGPAAKSRLHPEPGLALALALDCLDAVLACDAVGQVLVVTADPVTARAVGEVGAGHARVAVRARGAVGVRIVPESTPGGGLVAAVRDGVGQAPTGAPVGVLLADLPALRPRDLAAALAAAEAALAARPRPRMAAVPDADARGTVLLCARTPADLDPAFGPGSLAAHVARGAVRLDLDLPRLRRDVDTRADLAAALALGAGPRTTTASVAASASATAPA